MNINILSDEELAKEIYNRSKMSIHPSWKDIGGSKVLRKQALKIARFTRLCVKDSTPEGLTVKKIVKIINRHDDGDSLDDDKVDVLATAIYAAQERKAAVEKAKE